MIKKIPLPGDCALRIRWVWSGNDAVAGAAVIRRVFMRVSVDRFDLQGTPGNAHEKVGCLGHFSRPARLERETGMVIVAMRGGFIV